MSTGDGPLRLERDDGLAVVTFDAPPLNLFDPAMEDALVAALSELEVSAPRAVLFRAEGRVVSAGVDVGLFATLDGPSVAASVFQRWIELSRRAEMLPCPTVFAAHGLCLTWAFELALACDLIVASERAAFGLVEKVIGMTPAMGGTQRLAERAGSGRAKEFVMAGVPFDAAVLERWNVVNRLLPAEGFDDAARAIARELAAGPTLAHAATKRIVREFLVGGVDRADQRTGVIAGELFKSSDLKGAVASFVADGPGRASFRGD